MSVCAKASAPAPRLPSSLPPPVLAGPVHWGQIPCHKLRGSLVSSRGISLLETKFSLRPSPPPLPFEHPVAFPVASSFPLQEVGFVM